MKQAGAVAAAVILVVWLLWNLWNVYRITVGLRDGSWRRPMWWTRLCSVALLVGLASWIRGVFSTGLDLRKTCQFVHHQRYDAAYWESHTAEFRKLFPLHNKCNAHFDLVPGWVDPAVVVCAVVSLVAVAVLLGFGTARLISLSRKGNQS
ncbi:hypothetical protein [Streptomyces beijiangensis]|uniref:Uncharacterized protein n=1 Tax=Streptomyces beijiangensis TaxID=163361 RepID=A0A939F583_9ACTN|nr:hypothetical protein [Streptomyces beijiangensis]MBO0512128.1 hypothetical protein [Streptomyces beijiangensis]